MALELEQCVENLARRSVLARRLGGLNKQALDIPAPLQQLGRSIQSAYQSNPQLWQGALVGGGLGAAAGGLSSAFSGREERKYPLRNALTGAMAGGALGLGGQLLLQHGKPALQPLIDGTPVSNRLSQLAEAKGQTGMDSAVGAGVKSLKYTAPVAGVGAAADAGQQLYKDRLMGPKNLTEGAKVREAEKGWQEALKTITHSTGQKGEAPPQILQDKLKELGSIQQRGGRIRGAGAPDLSFIEKLVAKARSGIGMSPFPAGSANPTNITAHSPAEMLSIATAGRQSLREAAGKGVPGALSRGARVAGRGLLHGAMPAIVALLAGAGQHASANRRVKQLERQPLEGAE